MFFGFDRLRKPDLFVCYELVDSSIRVQREFVQKLTVGLGNRYLGAVGHCAELTDKCFYDFRRVGRFFQQFSSGTCPLWKSSFAVRSESRNPARDSNVASFRLLIAPSEKVSFRNPIKRPASQLTRLVKNADPELQVNCIIPAEGFKNCKSLRAKENL